MKCDAFYHRDTKRQTDLKQNNKKKTIAFINNSSFCSATCLSHVTLQKCNDWSKTRFWLQEDASYGEVGNGGRQK